MASSSGQIAGEYEYVKPGSDKLTQHLTLRADHTVSFTEHTDTSLEVTDSKGEGTWAIEGEQLKVVLATLTKTMKLKRPSMIPGIESGTATTANVAMPLTVKVQCFSPRPPFSSHLVPCIEVPCPVVTRVRV
jgi:hypothetical protein